MVHANLASSGEIRRWPRWYEWLIVAVVWAAAAGVVGYLFWYQASGRAWEDHNRDLLKTADAITIGMDEDAARELVTAHFKREYPSGRLPSTPRHEITAEVARAKSGNYCIAGYAHKERRVTNMVLVWISGDAILYLWIDKDGNVEDKFVGPS